MSITQKLGDELAKERKNAKSLEEKLSNMTNIFEERFSKKEEQVKEMKQKMSTHEGRINEMSDQGFLKILNFKLKIWGIFLNMNKATGKSLYH